MSDKFGDRLDKIERRHQLRCVHHALRQEEVGRCRMTTWHERYAERIGLYFAPDVVSGGLSLLDVETQRGAVVWEWDDAPERLRRLLPEDEQGSCVAWIPEGLTMTRFVQAIIDSGAATWAFQLDNVLVLITTERV